MNELLVKVLSDASARDADQLPLAASESASQFYPWSSVE
jgi:hypothetical protein